jgi:hypothetical protein
MEFIAPIPFEEAIKKLGDQSVIGSTFTSSEWGDLPLQLRDNAFFSSRIESARVLQRAQDLLGDFIAGNRTTTEAGETMLATGSRSAFVSQMQDFLAQEGIVRGAGGLTDITSESRLGLIFDVKTRQAQDFGWWKQGMDPDVLNEFPAMRFIRVRDVEEPRELHQRFEDQVYLKNDPIWWLEINHDFGTPWGPWGWGCGHDVEDVDRDEAEELHLIKAGETVQAPKKFLNLNTDLQASIKTLVPDLVEKLKQEFGKRIIVENDTLKWKVNYDERTGDSTSGRIDEPAQVNGPRIATAARRVFEEIRSRDNGKPFDPEISLAGGASIAAVAEGRKALYHEEWGLETGSDLARRLWGIKLPGVKVVLSDDGHLFAYDPALVQRIIDADPAAYPGPNLYAKIHQATLAGSNGELLGYGARSLMEPGHVRVEIFDGDTPVFGFFSQAEVADEFATQRTLDFARAYGRDFRYEIFR